MSVINFQKEIPHELMHALGLEHTFEEKEHPNKEHIFREGSTKIIWIMIILRKLLSNGNGYKCGNI